MAKQKSNWDKIQSQDLDQQVAYRDVYEDQQMDRSRIGEKKSPLSRNIITVLVTILAMFFAYALVGAGQYGIHKFRSISNKTMVDFYNPHEPLTDEQGYTVLKYDWRNPNNYIQSLQVIDPDTKLYVTVYRQINRNGAATSAIYRKPEDVPKPRWYIESKARYDAYKASPEGKKALQAYNDAIKLQKDKGNLMYWMYPDFWQILITLFVGLMVGGILHKFLMRNLDAQNLMLDTGDINQYQNDQHIALPEEIMSDFDFFPDVGAHSNVQVSSLISHVALTNKGLNKVKLTKRADKDITDKNGNVVYIKGEPLLDNNGSYIKEEHNMFNHKFMEDIFTTSDVPNDKKLRKYYEPLKIDYNKENKNRDKLKGYDTVADLINGDWIVPDYEWQLPAGAYIVDTAPVNTMVLAITRGGKGQTIIEPTIDMWLRERQPNNMVINDPKGELLKKFYVSATYRGFQVVQFNLINSLNTDIYNPLMMAGNSCREGDYTKVAMYVENIANVFFPVDGGEDPVWPNAANNAFKRAAYGLIDYFNEEELELRENARISGMSDEELATKVDMLWGKVTLYNCYQLFVQLSSKKMQNPMVEFTKKSKAGELDSLSNDEYNRQLDEVEKKSELLWENKPEIDLLTLYFNATDQLPKNQMRVLVGNANNALRSMGSAEKMLASVYGIAITAMSFFTDPTIATLTSGTPSQNVDLAGISFPRRLGFRMNGDFVKKNHLLGMQSRWRAYEDKEFTKEMGEDFRHNDMINRSNWARYYFKGKFEKDIVYLKCEVVNPQTNQLLKTFYFKFKKTYQKSFDGRVYIKDPILGEKIAKDGILTELRPFKDKKGHIVYKKGYTVFKSKAIRNLNSSPEVEDVSKTVITQFMTRYSEKPKVVFLVTPPHLTKYAKLILILIKQLVDLNFDQSYMTKENQKPYNFYYCMI